MLTEAYCRSKVVVLQPQASVAEAARAMKEKGIGAVLVADHRRLVGIVTDRDLAADVVARGEDPFATSVADVMHEDVRAVGPDSTIDDVLRAMRELGCRRVPIVDDGHIVGIVTLDDLLLDGRIDADEAASVLRAQLRPRPRGDGQRAAARSAARAENTYRRLVGVASRDTSLTPDRAAIALQLVVGAVCRRILPQEAAQFAAQLPSVLREGVRGHLDGPDRRVTRSSVEDELAALLGCDVERAVLILECLCVRLTSMVSAGEIAQVRRQLPADLAELFSEAPRWTD